MFDSLETDVIEIQKLLSSIIISCKNKLKGDVN